MDPAKGYRLKVSGVADLSRVLGGFRAEATRLLARRYATLVAREATWALDRWKLGLSGRDDDFIATACSSVRRRLASDGPIPFPDVNCVLSVHFIHDAVLASFVHGHDGYRKAWESIREVVAWGWSEDGPRPRGISEKAWEARGRYWKAAASGPPFGQGLRFTLVEDGLPGLGWGAVRRYLPSWDERVARASAALAKDVDPEEAKKLAEEVLVRHLSREALVAEGRPRTARRQPLPSPGGREEKPSAKDESAADKTAPVASSADDEGVTAAERIRREARKARKIREKAAARTDNDPGRAASIDHADVVLASDGRVFVATPYVGLDPENRVFLQVGDRHVAFSQGGVQYGHVTDVPKSAIDLLRTCKTVILVEVARKEGGGRLLRAKHVAIVSDISLSDSLSISLGGFRRASARGEKEIREWESRQ